jgi:hypothetical protein
MFTKNYLTTILNNLLLQLDVECSKRRDLTRLNVSGVLRQQLPLVKVSRKGDFVVPNYQTKYVKLTTKRKKTSSEKLASKTQIKSIKQIISNILDLVKSKIALPILSQFKLKKREFTEKDFKLIQNLVEKNKGDFPKSWQEFYQITGTNQNTFNN